MTRRGLVRLLTAAGLGAAAAVARALRLTSRQVRPGDVAEPDVDQDLVGGHLAELVRIATVSYDDRPPAAEAFRELHAFLEATYPKAHAALEREVVAEHSLLYTWPGSDPGAKPVLLMAHLDVVPVEPGTEEVWRHPPFEAVRADGFLWGRGAMDDKASVVGILEAVERLAGEGVRPSRTVHLAFGHDEEVGGSAGAGAIAALLESRGVRLEMVLDEGGFVSEGLLPIAGPVALVGTGEKGFLSVELTAESQGGHSSVPPRQTAVGVVAQAVTRLERHPIPSRPTGVRKTFAYLAPEMPLARRALYANFDLLWPVIERWMSRSPHGDALIRTTTATTMIEGGVKQNVLPRRARAVVNFRLLPGDTIASVLEHVRRIVADPRVRVSQLEGSPSADPIREASTDSEAFRILAGTILSVFPEAVVAPWTLTGMTDSRHYAPLADDVYRFVPFTWEPADRERVHGVDERLRLEDLPRVVGFYDRLLRAL